MLTRCLDGTEPLDDALQRYERIRLPRTSKLQMGSWRNCTTFHLPDGPEQRKRDEMYTRVNRDGPSALAALDPVQGYDALSVSLD